jgi:hypothetical protein
MKSASEHIVVFNESGCISHQGMNAYISGNCSDANRQRIERHLAECLFCSDALEGYLALENPAEVPVLLNNFKTELFAANSPHIRKSSGNFRSIFPVIGIAASLIVVLSLVFIFQTAKKDTSVELAVQQEQTTTTEKPIQAPIENQKESEKTAAVENRNGLEFLPQTVDDTEKGMVKGDRFASTKKTETSGEIYNGAGAGIFETNEESNAYRYDYKAGFDKDISQTVVTGAKLPVDESKSMDGESAISYAEDITVEDVPVKITATTAKVEVSKEKEVSAIKLKPESKNKNKSDNNLKVGNTRESDQSNSTSTAIPDVDLYKYGVYFYKQKNWGKSKGYFETLVQRGHGVYYESSRWYLAHIFIKESDFVSARNHLKFLADSSLNYKIKAASELKKINNK